MPANVGVEFTRSMMEPMVRGLFSRAKQDVVLATFEKAVVYATTDTIVPILLNHRWDRAASDLANLYLLSVGAKMLGDIEFRLRETFAYGREGTASCATTPSSSTSFDL